MGLFTSYFLSFETKGAEKVRTDTKQMESSVDKAAQAAEKAGNGADKSANSFKKLTSQAIKTLAPIAGLGVLLNRTLNFASYAEEMSYLAQTTGVAVDKFQALAIAAENYGGSAEGIAGSMQGLNRDLNNMRLGKGGGGVEEAALTYGINIYGQNGLATADELLMNVAQRFESLDSTQQVDLGQRLGLDEGTIRLLQTGVANVQKELERGSKFSLFSAEDMENSRKFQRTLRDVKLGLAQIFGVVARSLLPAFTWLGDKIKPFIDYILQHQNAVKGFFLALSAVMGVLALKSAIALSAVMGALALKSAMALLPILAIIAAAVLLAVIFEDFVAWLNGEDSFFKRLFGDPEPFKQAVKDALDWVREKLGALWDWISGKLRGWGKKLLGIEDDNSSKLDMADAQAKLQMTQSPWAAIPQGSMSTSYANNNQSVRVENVTIMTQATDSQGIASSLSDNVIQTAFNGMATSRI